MIKRLLLFFFLFTAPLVAQDFQYSTNFVNAKADTAAGGRNFLNTGINSFQIAWFPQLTVFGCAVQVDSSADGISWGSGDLIPSQNCATVGSSSTVSLASGKNFVRINVTSLTGGGALNVVLRGWGGGAGGGITSVAALPATCTPGTTAPVQLSVSPFGYWYCTAKNRWSNQDPTLAPIELMNDNFIRLDETPLSANGSWTNLPDTLQSGSLNLVSNQVQGTLGASTLGNTMVWTGKNANLFLANSNQWGKFTAGTTFTPNDNEGIFLNVQPTATRLSGISGQIQANTGGYGSGTTTMLITAIAMPLTEKVLATTTGMVNAGDIFEIDHIGPYCSLKQTPLSTGVQVTIFNNIWCGAVPGGGYLAIHTNLSPTPPMGAVSGGVFGQAATETVADSFTQTPQNPLPVGFWTTGTQGSCNLQIVASNIVEPVATATNCYAFYTHNSIGENQSSEIKINALTASSFASPVVHGAKISSTVWAGYQLRVPGPTGSSGSVLILRADSQGTFTTSETITGITPAVNDVFKLVAVNNPPVGISPASVTLTAYQNGVQIGVPVIDTVVSVDGIASAIMHGYPGISLNANAAITGSQIIGPWQSFQNPVGGSCTNAELALSAGWQSTGSATVTAAAGSGALCSWTITTGTTTAANPTVTDTFPVPLASQSIACELNIHGGTHTAVAGESFNQTTQSATAPVFTSNFTPTAGGTTYFVTRRCGP